MKFQLLCVYDHVFSKRICTPKTLAPYLKRNTNVFVSTHEKIHGMNLTCSTYPQNYFLIMVGGCWIYGVHFFLI